MSLPTCCPWAREAARKGRLRDERRTAHCGSVERVGGSAKGRGRGGPAKGSWPPFQPGHTLSTKHGAYAVLQLRPRAEEIATRIAASMGEAFEEKYVAAVEGAALAAARVERAMGVLLEEADDEKILRLSQDAKGWLRLYLDTLERLGLTPQVGVSGGPAGPVTLVVMTAFPGVGPHADVIDLEAVELPALEEGDE